MRPNEPRSEARRQALLKLAAGTAAFTVASCGRSDDARGALDFWAMGREAEVVTELLPAFHSRHPDIRVRVQQLPWTAAHEKLLTAYAGDALPDLCQLGNTWLPELSALDALEPLDAPVAKAGIARDDYFAGILDTNVMPSASGDRLLGLPWYVDTRGAFSQAPFRRALAFYADVFREGLAPAMNAAQISNVWDEFGRGLFAFYVSGPWNIGEFRRRLPSERQADWATAPLPGPDGPGFSTAGGSSLVIFKRSLRKAAAWRLVEYLSEPATMQRFHALTGNLPPRRSAWRTAELENDAPSQAFLRQLERVRAAPKIPEWERIFQAMQLSAERVVARKQDIGEATMQLDAWVDALLEKRRWLRARTPASAGRR